MIYSGKESQTVSNGHDNGALSVQTSAIPAMPAPVLTREISMWTEGSTPETPSSPVDSAPGVYYNPRLDPKNFLEGPLSPNPATRLRQMLARPGIVVSDSIFSLQTDVILNSSADCSGYLRWYQCTMRS